MFPKMNPRFERYVEPARKYPQLWRLIAGMALAMVLYLGIALGIFTLFSDVFLTRSAVGQSAYSSPLKTAVLFLTFVGMGLGILIAAQSFQRRGLASLLGPDPASIKRDFIRASVIIFFLLTVTSLISFAIYPPVANMKFTMWLGWLPLSLLLVFVQTSSEELVFRGYLQQQLAARFSSPWIWWLLPSALFALAHYDPDVMGPNTWLIVIDTFLIGLIAADVTSRTGNLGAAMGLHFVNNVFAVLFVTLNGDITGFALHVTPFTIADTEILRRLLLADIFFLTIAYLIYVRIMVRRGY